MRSFYNYEEGIGNNALARLNQATLEVDLLGMKRICADIGPRKVCCVV
jgi:hypothetical protein